MTFPREYDETETGLLGQWSGEDVEEEGEEDDGRRVVDIDTGYAPGHGARDLEFQMYGGGHRRIPVTLSSRWCLRFLVVVALAGPLAFVGISSMSQEGSPSPSGHEHRVVELDAVHVPTPCELAAMSSITTTITTTATTTVMITTSATTTIATTTSTTITTTTTTTTTTTKMFDCGNDVTLNFLDATKPQGWKAGSPVVTHSNLNGAGPDTGAANIRFSDIGTSGGKSFDLLVSSPTNKYTAPVLAGDSYAKWNGLYEGVGVVYMNNPGLMELKFQFVEAGTDTAIVLSKYYFTFLDVDTGSEACADSVMGYSDSQCKAKGIPITGDQTQGAEVLTVRDQSQHFLGPDSELALSKNANSDQVFTATVYGRGEDNPWYLATTPLTALQQNRAVTLLFEAKSEFTVSYQSAPGGTTPGREMLFTGKTSLADLPCAGGDADAATPAPSASAATAPTPDPEDLTTTASP